MGIDIFSYSPTIVVPTIILIIRKKKKKQTEWIDGGKECL